jgi:hypothetical protein
MPTTPVRRRISRLLMLVISALAHILPFPHGRDDVHEERTRSGVPYGTNRHR